MRTIWAKALTLSAAAALGAASLTGCGGSSTASSSADGGGNHKVVFTAGSTLVTDWDVYVAEDQGFFKKHGVEVENVTTETAEAANKLLVTGGAQVGRGLAPMIQSMSGSGGSLGLVDVGDALIRPPFYLNAKSDIKKPSDLKGKKIGTSSETDNTTIVTEAMLDKLGIPLSDVELPTAGGTSARFAGLQSGALDASLLFPPIAQKAVDAGFHSLGYVPDLMGDDYKYAFSSVIMNKDWLKKNPDVAKAYLEARDDALQFLNDPKNKDESIRILAKATNVDTKAAADTYKTLHIGTDISAFAPRIGVDDDAVEGTLSILKKVGQAPKDMTADELVDRTLSDSIRG